MQERRLQRGGPHEEQPTQVPEWLAALVVPAPWQLWLPQRFEQAARSVAAGQTVAVVPDGRLSRLFVEHLSRRHGDRVAVVRLDDASAQAGTQAVRPVEEAAAMTGVTRFFVTSAQHHRTLHERLVALGVAEGRIEDLARPPEPLSVLEASRLLAAAGNEDHACQIERFVGAHPVLVLFGPGYSDVFDKAAIAREAFGVRVIWVDPEASPGETPEPRADAELGLIHAATPDLFLFLTRRRSRHDVLVWGVNAARGYAAMALFKAAFPDVRVVGYVYDWLNLLCPPDHIDLCVRFLRTDRACAESEYRALQAMLAGEICDGIMHKDGGNDFELLADYRGPRLFFPPWPRRSLIRPPVQRGDERPRRILFMGAVLSERHHPRVLFGHGILFGVLERVAACGFEIDLYLWRVGPDIRQEYETRYRDHPGVRILTGAPLAELVPRVAGRYHWGWLLCDQEDGISHGHTRNTLAAKLFTYLALGIPVLATAAEACIAEFVRSRGVGVVVQREQIDRLDEVLDQVDYPALLENLRRAQPELALEEKQGALVDFLGEIMQGAWNTEMAAPSARR